MFRVVGRFLRFIWVYKHHGGTASCNWGWGSLQNLNLHLQTLDLDPLDIVDQIVIYLVLVQLFLIGLLIMMETIVYPYACNLIKPEAPSSGSEALFSLKPPPHTLIRG